MTSISIIGTTGVGKSFLVKQLAALNCCPAFFEGEIGVFTPRIMKLLATRTNQYELNSWFIARFKRMILAANKISSLRTDQIHRIDCYVDASMLYALAIHRATGSSARVIQHILQNVHLQTDKTVLIVMSPTGLRRMIKLRGRKIEQNKSYFDLCLRIQDELIAIANEQNKSGNKILIINRDKLDFTKNSDLKLISTKISKWARQI